MLRCAAWGYGYKNMGLQVEHEIHRRRFGRNVGLAFLLVAFVILVMALTVVKVTRGAVPPHAMDGTSFFVPNIAVVLA
jgi:hypothetical protein